MTIDFHCNLFTHASVERDWYGTPEMSRIIEWWKLHEKVKGRTVAEFVQMMDEADCDKVCIPAIRMYSYKRKEMVWDITEEEVLDVVKQAGGRIVGLAGFNPYKGMESVRQVERAVKEYGFKGAYIHPYGWGIPLNHRQFYPLYAKCAELGVPVSMQVGHSAEHMPNEFGRPIYMDDIALDFPELNIVGAHTGWPWTEEMISLAWKHENVFVGIDAHHPKYLEPTLIKFMATRGQDKVLWGTNFPAVPHKEAIQVIRNDLGLKPHVIQKVLHDNAARIYKL